MLNAGHHKKWREVRTKTASSYTLQTSTTTVFHHHPHIVDFQNQVVMVNYSSIASSLLILIVSSSHGFAPASLSRVAGNSLTSITQLNAIGVLARKAKEAEVRQYCETGIDDETMAKVREMKENLEKIPSIAEWDKTGPGPVQRGLTKRKGTITVIAEYKRTFTIASGFADEMFEPKVMSPTFREFGAAAVAVLADQRMGKCTYEDIKDVVEEQEEARGDVPGPLPVISSDLIVDEVQIARSAAAGAKAVLLNYSISGKKTDFFIKCSRALGMETLVGVSTKEEAQAAIDAGGRIIVVTGIDDADEKASVVADLNIPEGAAICTVASILANNNKALEEIEEAWLLRDKGFNAVFVSDCLYKSGNDPSEHAGAIIRGMIAKSSVKWASAKSMGGKGEGAREYLGDILM